MEQSQASTAAPHHAPAANKWLVALAVMLATIVEVLDMTIANVALDHIRGNLSAGVDEAAWVMTSYIVGNAIVIPLTGWLSGVFGRKRFFLFCIALFTTSSLLCGSAPNLLTLVFFRVLQGLSGGAMMPLSQAILMETFPTEEQGTAMAVWGTGMMVAPILGPLLGGWITDNYSWRWIFYINVPVGLIASLLVTLILVDPPYIKRKVKRIDWLGLSFLVLGMGCLQILLDKGEREDWFHSELIVTLAILSAVGLLLFVWQELRTKEPVVDLRILKNRTFTVGTVFTTIVMFGLYGTFVLIPLYCQLVAGYTPLLAGKVMSFQHLGTFLSIVLAGRLFNRIDPRLLVSLGCLAAGLGTWDMTHFNPQIDFWGIAWPGLFRGLGSGLIFVPLTTLSLGAVPKEQMGNASALFNMVRTIGGSIGIAMLIAFLSRGAQIHQNYLVAHIHPYNPELWQRFALVNSGALPGLASNGLQGESFLALVYGEVQRQALLMSFVDDFRLIAWIFFILIPVVFLMRRPQIPGGSVAAH
ncbi:MAG: DHA2 family efflux MFS transporter permease subunit [Deltaproteobacteria bacterium]|nr:DHA2 family efflux MFS transporter permease subunit [Deltaproteobacteria bacterium]